MSKEYHVGMQKLTKVTPLESYKLRSKMKVDESDQRSNYGVKSSAICCTCVFLQNTRTVWPMWSVLHMTGRIAHRVLHVKFGRLYVNFNSFFTYAVFFLKLREMGCVSLVMTIRITLTDEHTRTHLSWQNMPVLTYSLIETRSLVSYKKQILRFLRCWHFM